MLVVQTLVNRVPLVVVRGWGLNCLEVQVVTQIHSALGQYSSLESLRGFSDRAA